MDVGEAQSGNDGRGWKLSLLHRVDAGGDVQNLERLQRGYEHRVSTSRRRRQHVWVHSAAARRPRSDLVSSSLSLRFLSAVMSAVQHSTLRGTQWLKCKNQLEPGNCNSSLPLPLLVHGHVPFPVL